MKEPEQKILLVDDREYNLIALEKVLEITGAELVKARNGEEALAAVLKNVFSLALLDVQMPEMDGYELAELLRGNPSTKNLPIIFLTAVYSSSANVFRGYEAGAVDYIVKPYDPNILLSKVKVFLELDATKRELETHQNNLERLIEERTAQEKDTANKYGSLIESIGEVIYEYDIANDSIVWKGSHDEILGYSRNEMGSSFQDWMNLIHPDDMPKMKQAFQRSIDANLISQEYRCKKSNGNYHWVHNMGKLLLDENNLPYKYIGIIKDINKRKQQEESLQLSASVIEHSNDGVMITDIENNIVSVNPAFTRITGYSAEEVIGKTPNVLSSGFHDKEYYQAMWDQLETHGFWANEIVNKRKNGETYPQWLSIISINDKNNQPKNRVGVFSDLSDITQFKERLQYLAFYDQLTDLPNRSLLEERIQASIALANRDSDMFAILFIDLDRFKNINDTLGHRVGDDLLKFAAGKLQGAIRESDTLARFGGDEFVLVLHGVRSLNDAKMVADKILLIFDNNPFIQENHEIFISCSIGISIFPENGSNCEELIKAADTAMYQSKHTGGHQFSIYMDQMSENFLERLSLENDLRRSLERNELFIVYQPQIDVTNNMIVGCEALLRWNHPQHGLVPPGKFIPLAEETGLIGMIGEYVLDSAIQQGKIWYAEGHKDLRIALNVSSMQLRSPDINHLLSQVTSNAISDSCKIELEITESTLMKQSDDILKLLQIMRENGVQISIDDFGTGYSSLSYLKQLPIDRLKVDQSFVRNIAKDKDDAAIVTTIIAMANNLSLNVIAEGVETVEQLEYLSKHNCREAQGFLFSHPLPPEEISKAMSNGGIILPEALYSTPVAEAPSEVNS
jgi:diguanylate cyclase (GGDEF)-like protein/PAS domain S-box-containing protein